VHEPILEVIARIECSKTEFEIRSLIQTIYLGGIGIPGRILETIRMVTKPVGPSSCFQQAMVLS
jgi:hypothetical protein